MLSFQHNMTANIISQMLQITLQNLHEVNPVIVLAWMERVCGELILTEELCC